MRSYCLTDTGKKRNMNQDFIYGSMQRVGALPDLFVVADGMGGHNAGDFASRFVVDCFLSSLRSSSERTEIQAIEEAVAYANEQLIEKAKGERELDYRGERWRVLRSDPYKDWNGVILLIRRVKGNSAPAVPAAVEVG